MDTIRNEIRRCCALLFLMIVVLNSNSVAQGISRAQELRAGKGSSMTPQGLRSLFFSYPSFLTSDIQMPAFLYVDESITLFEDKRRFDFIIGMSPMFRLELMRNVPRILIEGGVGINLISTRQVDGRQLGSNFLFSPTLSGGIEIPWTHGLLGVFYTFRHLSNASMFEDNDGVNFQYIVFSINLRNF
jgi:hypothetical protein